MTDGQQWIIEGVGDLTYQDSKQACIVEIADPDTDDGLFVRFQSWRAESAVHENAGLHGKRLRVQITVLDE